MNPRQSTAGFWIIVALVAVLVGYPLSFGPVSRLAERRVLPVEVYGAAYKPIIQTAFYGPRPVRVTIWQWAKLWGAFTIVEDAL